MTEFPHPLRLAVGSHAKGSGQGCAMNVISYENGDLTITDMPACSDPMLARVVQRVNDTICTHRDGDLLCPACSIKVLDLAHRTVGTGGILSGTELHVVWVRVACEMARSVAHLNPDPRVMAAILAAEAWADKPTYAAYAAAANASAYAANASAANAYAANAYAAYAAYAASASAAYAAYAAYADGAYAAANAAANAAYAYAYAADTPRLDAAHTAIDIFQRLTGHTDRPIEPAVVHTAVDQMLTT